ncbi:MAG: HlyD family efflux transporter periplasmic adaptor subunit [Planctomycetota bacterium]
MPSGPPADDGLPTAVVDRSRPDRRRRSWLLQAAAVVGIAAAIGWWAWSADQQRRLAAEADAAVAAATALPPRVFALARLEPIGEVVEVAPPSGAGDARIARLLVDEGESIDAGQTIAVLDNRSRLEATRAVAAAQVSQAAAQLAQAEAENDALRAELGAALRADEARLATARVKAERERFLRRTNANSQDDVDDAELERQRAEQAVEEARARFERRLPAAEGVPVDIAVAREAVRVAEATLAETVTRLEQAVVTAPSAGVVLDVETRPGEPVAGSTIVVLGDTATMMARAEVYESDAFRVSVGDAVRLTGAALDEPLGGRVTCVGTLVKKQAIVDALPAANTDARVVEVMIRLDAGSTAAAARFVSMQVRAEFLP